MKNEFCRLCNAVPLPSLEIVPGSRFPKGGLLRSGSYCGAALHRRYLMTPASDSRVRPERKDGGHPALCNAPPQWLRMRHQSHQSHQNQLFLWIVKIVSRARNPLRMELRPRRTPKTKNRGCASALVEEKTVGSVFFRKKI